MRKVILEIIAALIISGLGSYAVVWRTETVHETRLKALEGGQKQQQDQRDQDMKVLYNIQGQVIGIADSIRSLQGDLRSIRK